MKFEVLVLLLLTSTGCLLAEDPVDIENGCSIEVREEFASQSSLDVFREGFIQGVRKIPLQARDVGVSILTFSESIGLGFLASKYPDFYSALSALGISGGTFNGVFLNRHRDWKRALLGSIVWIGAGIVYTVEPNKTTDPLTDGAAMWGFGMLTQAFTDAFIKRLA